MDPENLAALWQEATRPATGSECGERTAVIRAALEPPTPTERLRIADHLGGCSDCATAWKLARALEPITMTTAQRGPRRDWRWLAAAATVILAVGAGLTWQLSPRPASGPSPTRGVSVMLAAEPADGAILATAPMVLTMRTPAEIPDGTAFEVTLLDAEATQIWSGVAVGVLRVALPQTLALEPGTYFWQVRSADWYPGWQSALVRFEIASP